MTLLRIASLSFLLIIFLASCSRVSYDLLQKNDLNRIMYLKKNYGNYKKSDAVYIKTVKEGTPITDDGVEIKRDKLVKKPDSFRLEIETLPKGSTVSFIDTKQKYSNGIYLKPGRYTVEVEKEGYISYTKEISLYKNSVFKVNLQKAAKLKILTMPGAKITIPEITQEYYFGMLLPLGKYTIIVKKSGYKTYKKTISLQKDQELEITLVPKSF